ncbi:MAG TPA: pre-peptidase C-terminal domain-containing protein [Acidobacteriota bacterium]|nr:pre-peptidase C-terminal domain-containing protein [Acidobacteriota bacterium]
MTRKTQNYLLKLTYRSCSGLVLMTVAAFFFLASTIPAQANSGFGALSSQEEVFDQQTNCPAPPILSGQTVAGQLSLNDCSIGDGRVADFYSFDVAAGEQINALITPNFGPSLSLLDANGVVLRTRNTGSVTRIRLVYRAERAGKMILRVGSFLRETGPYNLTLYLSPCNAVPILSGVQVNGSLAEGDCISDAIDSTSDIARFADYYQFNGTAGQQVNVSQTGTYRSRVLLLDTNGVELASELGSGFSPYLCQFSFTLPRSGNYLVATTSFLSETFGNYSLTFTQSGGGGNQPPCTPIPISLGQTVNGNLEPGDCLFPGASSRYADVYGFNGSAGQLVTVTLSSSSFDTFLSLRTVDDTVLAENDDSNGSSNSRIVFTLPSNGSFKILAASFPAGATGAYTLTLSSNGGDNPCTYTVTPTLVKLPSSGGTGSVNISAETGCTWTASANDNCWLTILSGSTGNGKGAVNFMVAANSSGSRIGVLTVAGQMVIIQQDAGGSSQSPCTPVAIGVGQTVNGNLSAGDCPFPGNSTRYSDVYGFTGSPGQKVTVRMNSTAFDTFLSLRNASDIVLGENDDSNGSTNSQIVFTVPANGSFKIFATSYGAGSTGSYSLTISVSTPTVEPFQ